MTFVTTQRLDYADHTEEIASLNEILDTLKGTNSAAVTAILDRLAYLQQASLARLSLYDQREQRR
jgi:hypothetical protein